MPSAKWHPSCLSINVSRDLGPKVLGSNETSGGCFTNVSRALQNILSKFVYYRNHTSYENFKLKLCTWAQKPCFGHTYKVSAWNSHHKCHFWHCIFREIILESSRNVNETTPWPQAYLSTCLFSSCFCGSWCSPRLQADRQPTFRPNEPLSNRPPDLCITARGKILPWKISRHCENFWALTGLRIH